MFHCPVRRSGCVHDTGGVKGVQHRVGHENGLLVRGDVEAFVERWWEIKGDTYLTHVVVPTAEPGGLDEFDEPITSGHEDPVVLSPQRFADLPRSALETGLGLGVVGIKRYV